MVDKRQLGLAGEEYAAQLLVKANLRIVERNYRCPKGEIDLIVQDGEQIIFVEVRGRSTGKRGWGEETITEWKRRRLFATAAFYLASQGYRDYPPLRFDIIALRWNQEKPEVKWLQGVFN
ncbi:MAG: YraN family protein [Desulfitobacteriaceae bacterium]